MGEVHGEVETEGNVLVIKRIHVVYRIFLDGDLEDQQATIDRVHAIHHDNCPVYRSIQAAIDITTEYSLETS